MSFVLVKKISVRYLSSTKACCNMLKIKNNRYRFLKILVGTNFIGSKESLLRQLIASEQEKKIKVQFYNLLL